MSVFEQRKRRKSRGLRSPPKTPINSPAPLTGPGSAALIRPHARIAQSVEQGLKIPCRWFDSASGHQIQKALLARVGLFVSGARRPDDEPPPGSTKCTAFGDEREARSRRVGTAQRLFRSIRLRNGKPARRAVPLYPAPGGRMRNHRLVRPNAPHLATSAKREARRVGTAKSCSDHSASGMESPLARAAPLHPAPGARISNHRLIHPNAPHLATSAQHLPHPAPQNHKTVIHPLLSPPPHRQKQALTPTPGPIRPDLPFPHP